jgi:N-methylhydantoinase A
MQKKSQVRAAIDIGGTFTDLIYFKTDQDTKETKIIQCKVDTTPNLEVGVLNALVNSDLNIEDIDMLIHGTTVVINSLT